MEKTRIAILGGGPASLSTAYELSRTPSLRERYQIDVYQIGWRLGGKCASSRNRAARYRNEEHGLHVLGGFYHNVFSQLRPIYERWAAVSPLAIPFDKAFTPQNTFTLMQPEGSAWRAVSVELPRNDKPLGGAPEAVTVAESLRVMVDWLAVAIRQLMHGRCPDLWLKAVEGWDAPEQPHLEALATRLAEPSASPLQRIVDHGPDLQSAMRSLGEHHPPRGPDWIGVIELVAAIAIGLAKDHVQERGFDSLNHLEVTAWLKRHGASDRAVACPLLTAGYHYAFAFENGDWTRPNIAAGVGMRGLMRMVFGYHRSVLIHMEGGMGEIFVVPYYEVLRDQGVRFHFFHRVESLEPGAAGEIAAVRMRRQARVAAGSSAYEPLIRYDIGGDEESRRCWPEAPLYEQLEDGAAARDAGDLEKWIDSEGVGEAVTLRAGADFDISVLGLSMGALRETTRELAAVNPAWREMLDSAGVSPTISAQIWRSEPATSFHGVSQDRLMTGGAAPLDTWGDMSFLTRYEQPDAAGSRPGSLSYFCGPIVAGAGRERATRPALETEAWLRANAAHIFPGLDDGAGGYRADGEIERCSRINDDPIDLYVCSPAGSIDKRLRPDGSGFSNLMLAGDWTRNNFDCGAVETAALSGKLCARAISGEPAVIFGESDFD